MPDSAKRRLSIRNGLVLTLFGAAFLQGCAEPGASIEGRVRSVVGESYFPKLEIRATTSTDIKEEMNRARYVGPVNEEGLFRLSPLLPRRAYRLESATESCSFNLLEVESPEAGLTRVLSGEVAVFCVPEGPFSSVLREDYVLVDFSTQSDSTCGVRMRDEFEGQGGTLFAVSHPNGLYNFSWLGQVSAASITRLRQDKGCVRTIAALSGAGFPRFSQELVRFVVRCAESGPDTCREVYRLIGERALATHAAALFMGRELDRLYSIGPPISESLKAAFPRGTMILEEVQVAPVGDAARGRAVIEADDLSARHLVRDAWRFRAKAVTLSRILLPALISTPCRTVAT